MRILVTGGARDVGSVSFAGAVVEGPARGDGSSGARHTVAGLLRSAGIEAVLHCAAKSLVGESMADPASYYRHNVAGGVALLDAMRDAGGDRIGVFFTA